MENRIMCVYQNNEKNDEKDINKIVKKLHEEYGVFDPDVPEKDLKRYWETHILKNLEQISLQMCKDACIDYACERIKEDPLQMINVMAKYYDSIGKGFVITIKYMQGIAVDFDKLEQELNKLTYDEVRILSCKM